MPNGQGKDRRSMAGGTPRSMRDTHPAAGPTASLSLASWLPARTRAWPTISFVPLASSLASNLSATTVRATRPERTSPRLAGRSGRPRSRGPCGCTSNGSVVCMSARSQGPLRPYGTKKSAAMELTSRLLNDNRDEDCDRAAGCGSERARAGLSPPRWSYRWPAPLAVPE
jgi:hypothetical protein